MDLELDGQVVLITGGTDGLGLALASQLATEGASVAVCGRDEERLRVARATLADAGGDVLAQRADVSSPADLEAFVDAAVGRWGRIDGVVHNAGPAGGRALRVDRRRGVGVRHRPEAHGRGPSDPPGPAAPAGQPGRRPVHPRHGRQGARRGQRAELGHPRCRNGAHEGALQGAGARRHPGQRRADRVDRERAVGPGRGRLGPGAGRVLRALRPGLGHPYWAASVAPGSSPTWAASCSRPAPRTSPARPINLDGGLSPAV